MAMNFQQRCRRRGDGVAPGGRGCRGSWGV